MGGDEDVPLDYYVADESLVGSAETGAKPGPKVERGAGTGAGAMANPKRRKGGKSGERFDFWLETPKAIASHVHSLYRTYHPGLSSLEDQAVARTVASLSFGRTCSRIGRSLLDTTAPGCTVLVLCSSALECIAVIKETGRGTRGSRVAKCFARHIKVGEQLDLLRKRMHPIAVGTPGRILSILTTDPSVFSSVSTIVIDVKRDVKLRSIFDIPETVQPLLAILLEHVSRFDKPQLLFLTHPQAEET